MRTVQVAVLGPLQLAVDGAEVEVHGAKVRALLARLALAEARPVTVERLLDALWLEEEPGAGKQALQSLVSRLRKQLGVAGDLLATTPGGYRLELAADALDLSRARALLRIARSELAGDPAGAHARMVAAAALWRGPMLADVAELGWVATAAREAEQLHREVLDTLVAAAIADGNAESVVALSGAAVEEDPLRERAVLLYMQALAATGEARAALQVAREFRRRLADETGLDPSPALNAAELSVAGGDVGATVSATSRPADPATPLFGRRSDIAALHQLLASDRLVTVVGPGGVGKTRVGMEIARRADAATVLLLAPVTDPAAVPFALADAMGLAVERGDVLAACLAMIGDDARLLVIDNCEHLLDAARELVARLLTECPRVEVLATSREPLGIPAEHVFRLAPLATPPAVEAFLDRAARVRDGALDAADREVVTDIVRRLDGVPLAIELAAGRLSSFSATELLERLDRALDLLSRARPGADSRHGSLRATVAWSYRLLSEDEQRLFRQLAVFVDGVDLDTVERVAADLGIAADPGTVLARLVDASMLDAVFAGDGRTRYRMLETLRAFGLDRLVAAGEAEQAETRLVEWAVAQARRFAATAPTGAEAEADAALRRELANLRAAWRSARMHGLVEPAAAIVASLFDAVMSRDLVEVRAWARELADDPRLSGPHEAAVLGAAAYAAYAAGEQDRAEAYARAGLTAGGDDDPHCRHALSVIALARGAWQEAVDHALAGTDADPHQRHGFLGLAALGSAYGGDLDRARSFNQRWLAAASSPSRRAWATYYQGEIENLAGERELADARYREAVTLGRSAGDTFVIGVATIGRASLLALDGELDDALAGYRDVIELFARTGYWTHQWIALRNVAGVLRRLGDAETADVIEAAADAALDAPATPTTSRSLVASGADDVPTAEGPDRNQVLELTRSAIRRRLDPAGPA